MLVLFAGILSVSAELCNEKHCMMQEIVADEVRGASLISTGSSVLPSIGMNGPKLALSEGLVDEFAAIEDEFDHSSAEAYKPLHDQTAASRGLGATLKSMSLVPELNRFAIEILTLLVLAVA